MLAYALAFLTCFLLVTVFRPSFHGLDMEVSLWSASINNGLFMPAASTISFWFDTLRLFAITLAFAFILFVSHHRRYSFLILGAMGGNALLVDFLKKITASSRPPDELLNVTSFSYPSGHTAGAVVLFGILTYFAWKHWGTTRIKAITVGLYVAVTAVVGFDRIYLNVHWFSDVFGAVLFGAFWLVFCIIIFNLALSTDRMQMYFNRARSKTTWDKHHNGCPYSSHDILINS